MKIGDSYVHRNQADEIATLTGTCKRTVRRWFAAGQFPPAIELLLRLVYDGDLSIICPDWQGFWIQRRYGVLVTDQGYTYRPGELRAFSIRAHQFAHLEMQVRELEAERDVLLARAQKPTAKLFKFPVVPRQRAFNPPQLDTQCRERAGERGHADTDVIE